MRRDPFDTQATWRMLDVRRACRFWISAPLFSSLLKLHRERS